MRVRVKRARKLIYQAVERVTEAVRKGGFCLLGIRLLGIRLFKYPVLAHQLIEAAIAFHQICSD
jgi:hypothetical protein